MNKLFLWGIRRMELQTRTLCLEAAFCMGPLKYGSPCSWPQCAQTWCHLLSVLKQFCHTLTLHIDTSVQKS